LDASPEDTRGFFSRFERVRDGWFTGEYGKMEDFSYLSMGMSQDYLLAVEKCATIVRIGMCDFWAKNNYK
jgi:uncharacterized pyridoxal phosphate-containing UPF0001 family protein